MFFCGECCGREEVESIQAFACEEKGSNSQPLLSKITVSGTG
jgi:hypothetical protein